MKPACGQNLKLLVSHYVGKLTLRMAALRSQVRLLYFPLQICKSIVSDDRSMRVVEIY